ncbi:MAG TPA: carbohydrate-binding protein [Kiritimatiellia bacterium]|nr:carbohydrate-binding protein [Kiritimatiellia bacterium]
MIFPRYAIFVWALFVAVAGAQSVRPGLGSIPYADAGGTGVTFRVWAPNATSVGVKGQFSGWATLTLTKEGATPYWSRDVAGAQAGQEYKYVLNNSFEKRDPRARRVTNSNGNSIIHDPNAFDWGGVETVVPWLNDLVIYEMHVGTFNAEAWVPNTFDQAIEKLDHLVDLGVSAVQVMPVAEFAGDKSWGYNPADPFAIESALGGPDAFRRFVKACHQRGIAVLVDVVHNHYGPSDLALWRFDGWSANGKGGIYFYNDFRSSTLWGDTRPDYGRAEVRDYIRDNILMFLQEYRVGGFRWDSVWSMLYANNGTTHLPDAENLLRDINWMMQTGFPGRIRIAEDHAFDFNMNFDSQWDVQFHDHIKWQVTRGSDSERNMNWLADRIANWASHNRVIFSESHDSVGGLNDKQRLPRDIDGSNPASIWARKRQLLAAGITLTAPGIPMLFQGQEMNEDWTFAAETALRWSLTNTHAGIVRAYSDLVHLRRNRWGGTQGLKGTGVNVHHKDDLNKVIAYVRWDAGGGADDVVVAANFSAQNFTNNTYLIEFPSAGTWYPYFNGDSTNYAADFGNVKQLHPSGSVTASGTPPKAAVNMGMYSLQIFSKTPLVAPGQVSLDPPLPEGCVTIEIAYDPFGTALAGATQIVAAVGVNGWQDTVDVVLTNLGARWYGTFAIPFDTHTLDLAFHNGVEVGRVWDNNRGRDWHFPVAGCADQPARATVNPLNPQGCVPVTITYEEWSGPLKNATNVVLFIGRNGWQNIEELPMTESSPGVWSVEKSVPPDTWQLEFVFHDNAQSNRIWDNNGGQDWRTYVVNCVDPMQPSVTITNPPSDTVVSNDVDQFTVRGKTGPGLSGFLLWTNQLTGSAGTIPAATNWALPAQALAEGVNLIRVSGTNSAINPNAASRDAATNQPYIGAGWLNGQNGGTGWGGGWQLSGGANAGFFLASTSGVANLQSGTHAWALWAHSEGLSAAVRPLAGKLNVGDVLRVQFENGGIDDFGSTGIGLQNRFGQNLLEFLFIGGDTNYVFNDSVIGRPTGLPWTDQGLGLALELTSPMTYQLTVNSNIVLTGTLAITSESVIDRIRVWNFKTGGGEERNVYFTDLRIDGPPELESGVFQSEVAITRAYGPFSDPDGDGFLTWEEEFAGTNPFDASSHLADIGWMPIGAASYIEIPNSAPGRWYDLYVRTDLVHGAWTRFGVERQGTGGSIWLDFTNHAATAFYRTGVYEP